MVFGWNWGLWRRALPVLHKPGHCAGAVHFSASFKRVFTSLCSELCGAIGPHAESVNTLLKCPAHVCPSLSHTPNQRTRALALGADGGFGRGFGDRFVLCASGLAGAGCGVGQW